MFVTSQILCCFIFLMVPMLVGRFHGNNVPPKEIKPDFVIKGEEFYGDERGLVLSTEAQWSHPGSRFTELHSFVSQGFGPPVCHSSINSCYMETRRRLWLPKAKRISPDGGKLRKENYISFRTDIPNFPTIPLDKIQAELPELLRISCDDCSIHPRKTLPYSGDKYNVFWKPIILEVTTADMKRSPYNITMKLYFTLLLENKELDVIYFGLNSTLLKKYQDYPNSRHL